MTIDPTILSETLAESAARQRRLIRSLYAALNPKPVETAKPKCQETSK